MVDTNLVATKLRELAERIARVRMHCPPEVSDLAADPDALDLVSFNLLLAVQACVDLASHLISDEDWPPAETYAEAFQRLHEQGVLTRETADTLGSAAGPSKAIAYCFGGVDAELIRRAAVHSLPALELFASEVSIWLEGRSSEGGPRIVDNPSFAKLQRDLHGAKQLMRLRPLLRLLGMHIDNGAVTQLKKLDQSFQKIATLPDRFNDLFLERGWIAYELLKTEVVQHAVELGEADQVVEAEQLLVEHFDEETINWGIKFMWGVEAFRPRERLARLALEDYLQGRYHACVPVLLMIIDGLVNDVHGSKGFFADGIDLTAWDSIAAHDRGLQALNNLWRKGRKKTTTEAITLPYRHGILHGRDLGYDNRPVAAKLWAALFALRAWALAVQNNRVEEPPPEPKPSLWETLERYRRVSKKRAELETWKPRTEEQLAAIPRSGEPEAYEPGSPERAVAELMRLWSRKNYGHMAQLIHLPFEGPFDSREAGPIAKELREILEEKQLRAFRFLEIQDQGAAVTTVKLAIDLEENGGAVKKDLTLHLTYADEHGTAFRGKPGGIWAIQDLWSAIY